jgi:hypothetical protein
MPNNRILVCAIPLRAEAIAALASITDSNQDGAFPPNLQFVASPPDPLPDPYPDPFEASHGVASAPFSQAEVTELEAIAASSVEAIDADHPWVISEPGENYPSFRERNNLFPEP